MGLTWRDGVATLFMAVIAAIYVAFLGGTSAWLISSARGTTTAVLVAATFALWLLSTARHAFTHRPGAGIHRDEHEVIQPSDPAKH